MHQKMGELAVPTNGQGCYEASRQIASWLSSNYCDEGLLTIFIRHTSASLTIQENADGDVQSDLYDALDRLAPQSSTYRHSSEGPDDMPAHIKSAITSTCLTIPVMDGKMMLGTWQGIFLLEHRDSVHTRKLVVHFLGNQK